MNITIENMSELELKALAYDLSKKIQQGSRQLQIIENEIVNRRRQAMNVVEKLKNVKTESKVKKEEAVKEKTKDILKRK